MQNSRIIQYTVYESRGIQLYVVEILNFALPFFDCNEIVLLCINYFV